MRKSKRKESVWIETKDFFILRSKKKLPKAKADWIIESKVIESQIK